MQRRAESAAREHVAALVDCLAELGDAGARVTEWGRRLYRTLDAGGRLLAAGNGGSAAQAQHLTAELVGRFCDDRPGFSAICLSSETSTLTAILNDYGAEDVFARQVRAHGRPGDVLVCLSTSGCSRNVVAAARAAVDAGLVVWALTGPTPNPLAEVATEAVEVDAASTATAQEVHLVLLHLLCVGFDELACTRGRAGDGKAQSAVATASGTRLPESKATV